jgi:DNA-binding MarR family transcriptional regulator
MAFDLQAYLPYLLNRAARRIVAGFTEQIRPLGVGLTEWRVLAALLEGDAARIDALALATSIDASTLSRLVQRMAGDGLLLRTVSQQDRRAVAISLSSKGRDLAERIVPIALAWEGKMLGSLDPETTESLRQLLRRLDQNLAAPEAVS